MELFEHELIKKFLEVIKNSLENDELFCELTVRGFLNSLEVVLVIEPWFFRVFFDNVLR